jgi:hypothetical protein
MKTGFKANQLRYDWARSSLEWHATYIVAVFIAGAARWRHVSVRVHAHRDPDTTPDGVAG